MKRLIIATFLGAAALTAPVASSTAQSFNPFEIGGALGAAIPVGDFGDAADVGYNATFILGYKPAFSPLGFRFDAAYNEMGDELFTDESFQIPSFTGNVVFEMPTAGFRPYLIGGGGLYRIDSSIPNTDAENKFGFNVGAGISMPLSGFKVFVEARYNHVSLDGGNVTFVPVTFGAIF